MFAIHTGGSITNINDKLSWWKYLSWKQGISPREFALCDVKDMKEIIMIRNASISKRKATAEVSKAVAELFS